MGAQVADAEPSSTPKLSLFSLPNHQVTEPPGMLTPPLRTPASIPFLWEEVPGKPLPSSTTTTRSLARCLELPPRLLSEAKMTNIPSPTTVLEGPYVRRSSSHSIVFSRERLTSSEEEMGGSFSKRTESCGGRSGYFGGGTWGRRNSKRNTRVCEDSTVISHSSSSSLADSKDSGCNNTKVKITRIRRAGSFLSFSSSRPHNHFLASVYGSLKQVVPLPWRTRKIKKDGLSF